MNRKAETAYTPSEELANAVTHGVGAVLSVIALVAMIIRSGGPWKVLAVSVFGASLILLYTSSTLYHAFPWPRVKKVFQTFDHVTIYLLIAGSYTPFALVTFGGTMGWAIFGVIWTLALGGTLFELLSRGKKWKIALFFYLGMGWIALFFIKSLVELLPTWGMTLLVAGGLLYSLGTIFYAWKSLPFNHALWHLFVLGGSAAHFFCIMDSVL